MRLHAEPRCAHMHWALPCQEAFLLMQSQALCVRIQGIVTAGSYLLNRVASGWLRVVGCEWA